LLTDISNKLDKLCTDENTLSEGLGQIKQSIQSLQSTACQTQHPTPHTPQNMPPPIERPGCNQTCIDNILANDIENVILSGTLSTCISHHHAVFPIFNSPIFTNKAPTQKYFQHYDYSSANISKFIKGLERELSAEPPENFSNFSRVF
jgi:hypothetical protein